MGRYGMLDCAKNFRTKYGNTKCTVCQVEDDEQHRIGNCSKWIKERESNCGQISFSNVYSDNFETLRETAKHILDFWQIDHGKNRMRFES